MDNDLVNEEREYLVFLAAAGSGCISGHLSEWPQLIPSIKWILEEREKLLKEISELDRDEVQRENVKLGRERDQAIKEKETYRKAGIKMWLMILDLTIQMQEFNK